MHPGERRQPHIAGGLGLVDRQLQGGRTACRSHRPGIALVRDWTAGTPPSAESRAVARSPRRDRGAATASSNRCWRRASSPSIASPRTCSHGSSTVRSQCCTWSTRLDAALLVAGRDRGPGGEQPVRGLVPRPVQPVVEGVAALGEFHRLTELAVMRHDVGEVVRAARLQVDVIDRVGQLGGGGDVVAGEIEVTGRRFDPRREQQGVGPVPGRRRVAGRVERGQDSLRASAVAENDPRPAEPVDDAQREQRVVRRRSRPTRRRCWRARRGRRPGARLGDCCARPGWRTSAASANHAACAASARVGQPGVGHRLERERPDAVQQPVAHGRRCASIRWSWAATQRRRRRSPVSGSRADRPRRSPRPPARRALRGRTPPPAAVRHRRRWPGPRVLAGRRGTTGRSSIGSSTCSARRRSGRRLVGSLNTANRSSRRRVISSIDNVLVRAAASSIASGRPSSERHRSCTASSPSLDVRLSALCRGPPGEQLDGVGERQGLRVRTRPHRRRRVAPGWCTGSAAPGAASRRRTASAAAASTTCSQLSRITTAALPLSRSNSAASPPGTFNAAITVSMTSSAVTAVSSLANQTPPIPRRSTR